MNGFKENIEEFSNKKNIAVAGVSRNPQGAVGNIIYKKLKSSGYNTFAVNPNAIEVEGDKCYPNVKSIPSDIEAVVIATHPSKAVEVVNGCAEAGVSLVWFHNAIGSGSFSKDAIKLCEEKNISYIPSGCPMMYIKPVDFGHKCIKGMLKLTGKIPFGV